MAQSAFQDLLGAHNHCYGCGAINEHGLQIKSYWDGLDAVCNWQPQPYHCAGATQVVNGGIIASLIDCHSINLAMADAYRRTNRPIASQPYLWYVTANLNVTYLHPTPINHLLHLHAKVVKIEGRKTWVHCTLAAGGQTTATGEVLGIALQTDTAVPPPSS